MPAVRLLLLLLLFTTSIDARADGGDARVLFAEGQALMDAERYEEACDKFAKSQELSADAHTAHALGDCFERRGMFATAWVTFKTAVDLAKHDQQVEQEALSRRAMEALQPKVSRVTLTVTSSIAGEEVTLDRQPVGFAVFGKPIPLDPGTHVVEATAPGYQTWSTEVVVPEEAASLSVKVPVLARIAVELPSPSAPVAKPKAAKKPPPPEPRPSISPLAYVGLSIGVAGLVVGTITGIVAISNSNAIKDRCEDELCPPSEQPLIEDAERVASVSNVAFGVAGAGAVLAVIGFLLETEPEPFTAVVGPGYLGLQGTF